MKIRPVILCGGAGTRLWPQSKENLPKQFKSNHLIQFFINYPFKAFFIKQNVMKMI